MKKRIFKDFFFCFFLILILSLFCLSSYESFSNDKYVDEFINNKDTYLSIVEKKEVEPYLFVIEIPKIHLKKGVYSLSSSLNTVSKNIQLISGSKMPDQEYANLILAAHSGTSSISYFKNLDQLEYGDEVFIYYKDTVYNYRLIDIYKEKKDGTVVIHRKKKQSNLTLITCDKTNASLQMVYMFVMCS